MILEITGNENGNYLMGLGEIELLIAFSYISVVWIRRYVGYTSRPV